jgi:hypothetical protein
MEEGEMHRDRFWASGQVLRVGFLLRLSVGTSELALGLGKKDRL